MMSDPSENVAAKQEADEEFEDVPDWFYRLLTYIIFAWMWFDPFGQFEMTTHGLKEAVGMAVLAVLISEVIILRRRRRRHR